MVEAAGGDSDETVVSWLAVKPGQPVITADGKELGHVVEVAGLPEDDIFSGVVYRSGMLSHRRLAPAADIDRITTRAVYLTTTGDAAGDHAEA